MAADASALRRLGKYELIARIGEGGMAEVYLARQRGPMDFEKVVVVKTIHPHLGRKKKFINMLLDEARIAARLKHPCVVDIYDLGVEDETYFIAMEHLAGETMLAVLRACVKQKPLDVPCTARIVADIADGLQAAHDLKDSRGRPLDLVHRDITPGNIVVLYTGQVKILDFGIAKARGRLADETDADHFKGKLGYISPEQVKGEDIDRRSDIFSLGVVMWEALALRRLFRKSNPAAAAEAIIKESIPPPSKYRSAVPPKLDSICMRALARDPGDRYATAAEMQEDIERFLAAGSFRPHKAAIRKYMQEVFADRIESREQLLHRVAVATSEFRVPARLSTDSDLEPTSGEGRVLDELPNRASGPVRMPTGPATPGRAESPPAVTAIAGEQRSGPNRVAVASVPPLAAGMSAENKRLWGGIAAAVVLVLIVIAAVIGDEESGSAAPQAAAAESAAAAEAAAEAAETDRETETVAGLAVEPEPAVEPDSIADGPAAPLAGDEDALAADTEDTEPGASPGASDDPDGGAGAAAPGQDRREGAEDEARAGDSSDETRRASRPKRSGRTTPRGNPSELYDEGIQYFVSGKLSAARGKFRAALKARSGYAPAYRGLGLVYERQGKKRQAASAFRKYLRLAPDAPDRQSIRKRLAALGN